MELDVCVVGYGLMGRTHAEMYAKNHDVGRIKIIDPFLEMSNQKISNKNAQKDMIFANHVDSEDMFDAVSICVPSAYHLAVFEEYKNKTRAFLIEKPLTLSLAEAKRMQEIRDDLELIIGCAFVERFNPLIVELKSEISGKGERGNYSFKRIAPFPSSVSWYHDEKISGGPLFDLGVHDIDLANYLIGEKMSVLSVEEIGKIITCRLISESRLSAEIITGWHDGQEFINKISFDGKNFSSHLSGAELESWRYPYSYQKEIDGFIHFLMGNQPNFPSITDGIKALKVIDSINMMRYKQNE